MRKCGATLLLVLAGLAGACTPSPGDGTAGGSGYDVIIANGRIVDGTGNAWYPGDIGIRGESVRSPGSVVCTQSMAR